MDLLFSFSSSAITVLLLFIGIYFTLRTRLFQFINLPLCIKNTFSCLKNKDKKGIACLFLALGGTVGVGNISGVGAAIALGGAGSIFWMWICAALGMITKYVEVLLAVKFKPFGPFTYIKNTFNKYGKLISAIFAFSCIFSSFLIGNVFQCKAVVDTFVTVFNFDRIFMILIICIPVAILAFSNSDFIKRFSCFAVPFVTLLYIVMTLIVILKNMKFLPSAISEIFVGAFNIKSAPGGIIGFILSSTVRQGMSKGLFSHEAGMGSSPIAYSSEDNDTQKSAQLGVLEVFIDTFVISTLTALSMLTSGFYEENGMISAAKMLMSFFGRFGGVAFAVAVYLFCIASISGWLFYGKRAVEYLSQKTFYIKLYSAVFVLIIPFVVILPIGIIWKLSDFTMLCMTVPNVISLLNYRKYILSDVRKCKSDRKELQSLCQKVQRFKG